MLFPKSVADWLPSVLVKQLSDAKWFRETCSSTLPAWFVWKLFGRRFSQPPLPPLPGCLTDEHVSAL